MGFDVSWHPISQKEMLRWYFDRLPELLRGDTSGMEAVLDQYRPGREKGHEGFCRKGYRELLEQGARKRGMLISGGEADTERMAKVLLDEFRGGRLGRFTLELPE